MIVALCQVPEYLISSGKREKMVGFQPTTNVFQPGLHMGESSKGHASDPLEGCSLHAVYLHTSVHYPQKVSSCKKILQTQGFATLT